MDFFKQKKKEIEMCDIEQLIKDELNNSINILDMMAMINISYQESVDLHFRIDMLNEADQILNVIIEDLRRLWLVRNKYSRLDKSVGNLLKVKEFIKISKEYYQGGKDETKN